MRRVRREPVAEAHVLNLARVASGSSLGGPMSMKTGAPCAASLRMTGKDWIASQSCAVVYMSSLWPSAAESEPETPRRQERRQTVVREIAAEALPPKRDCHIDRAHTQDAFLRDYCRVCFVNYFNHRLSSFRDCKPEAGPSGAAPAAAASSGARPQLPQPPAEPKPEKGRWIGRHRPVHRV